MERKLAVVTGAGSGIGRATVWELYKRGYKILGLGRRLEKLQSMKEDVGGDRIEVRSVDVRSLDSMKALSKSVGSVDALVINAGICRRAGLGDLRGPEVWREVLDTNLTGAFNTLWVLFSHLQKGGGVVVVSSGLGKLGRPRCSAYAASKHGLLGLTKCAAEELAPRGIRMNAVCPGWVETEMAGNDLEEAARQDGVSPLQVKRKAVSQIPLGRFVTPEEVADLIGFLLSENAAAITGQALNISGGEFFA